MDKQTCKMIARIAENLPVMSPDIMQGWIDNPRGLQKFLTGLVPVENVTATPREFPLYIECEVGGKSKDEILVEIDANGMFASDYAKDIMSKDAWQPGEKEVVRFARVKIRDLGFAKQPTTDEVWARIKELGHSLCLPCDGPVLRLALKDQRMGDICWTAMEQIADSGGHPDVFALGRHGGGERWLGGFWTFRGYRWNLDRGVVFRLRK